jgi:hypothetical protein
MAPREHRTDVRPFSRIPPSSFEGATRRPYESGWHSVAQLTLALPHSGRDGLTGGVGGTAPGRDSQACEGRGVDSSLTLAPASVRALNPPVGGAGMGAASPRGPRARRNPSRGGVQPPSEAEPYPRGRSVLDRGGISSEGRLTLERGGTSLEEESGPQAIRKSTNGVSCPSSEAEFCSRVAGPSAWWAVGATRAVGPGVEPWVYLKHVLGSFVFCFCESKWFSQVV